MSAARTLERDPATPDGVLSGSRRALTIGLLLVVSTVAFEALAVATVLPAAVEDIGGLTLYGWAFSAFLLSALVSTIAAGQEADRRGPELPFLVGVIAFGAGLVVAGLAPVMPVFIAGRALQGLGAGAITAMAYVGIGRGYPDALRARMLALLSSAWVMPALIGPGIAGVLADSLTWRLVFLGLLPLVVVATLLTLPSLRQMAIAEPDLSGPSLLPAALRLTAGTGLLLVGLELDHLLLALGVVAAGVALALPALRQLMPAGTLTARRGLPAGLAVNGLLALGFFTAEAFMPLGLTSLRGLSTGEAGITLTAAALTWASGAWVQARWDGRDAGAGRPGRVTAGFVLVLLGVCLMALTVLAEQVPVAVAVLGWAVAGLGMGLAYPTLSLLVLAQAREGEEGAASSSLRVAEQLTAAVGAGLGGAVIALSQQLGWSERDGLAAAFALATAGTVLGLVASRRLRMR